MSSSFWFVHVGSEKTGWGKEFPDTAIFGVVAQIVDFKLKHFSFSFNFVNLLTDFWIFKRLIE